MTARALHRFVGIVMLLPFLGWAITGAIFFVKPGYGGAYEALAVKTYPLESSVTLGPNPAWLEVRYLKTVLGEHLLVRTADGWQQLDPHSLRPRSVPDEPGLRALVGDAFAANPSRYGQIASVEIAPGGNSVITTDTGVRATLNWSRLALSQRGRDTDRIDSIYRIHYLQWTGIIVLDRIVGAIGLALIVLLTALGVRLLLRTR